RGSTSGLQPIRRTDRIRWFDDSRSKFGRWDYHSVTEPSTIHDIDATVKPQLLKLLKCGDLPTARRLAECVGMTWLVRNIDASKDHIESVVEYIREYSSDAPCGRPRKAGFGHSKQLSRRQNQISQWIVMTQERASHVLDV